MGKSSLKVQTMQRLQAEGVACAAIDLTRIGTSDMQPEQWYSSVIDSIVSSLDLYETFDLYSWWEEHHLLSYVRRFDKFIDEVLLTAIPQPLIIFIDEIDSVLSLPFNLDDFFAFIRECYNRRSEKPDYDRLTFALLGVTTPSDLMQDKQRTPFNVGRPIELMGFQLHEADPLAQGLAAKSSDPTALMQAVLDWTGGQPFLTQKVCKLILSATDAASIGEEAAWVDALVRSRVIENWEAQDTPEHLKTIRDRLLLSGEERTGRLLGLYQQIVQQGEVGADDSAEQVDLRLTGVVVKREGMLRVYNRVYEQVFDHDWLEQSLAALRPYGVAIAAWLDSGMQDESRLLRGQTLQDARTWAEGKSLGDDDRRFLDASQELEKRDIQKRFDLEAEEKRILANANRKANRRIGFGSIALVSMLAIAITSVIAAQQRIGAADQKVKAADQKVTESKGEAEKFQGEATKAEDNRKLAVARGKDAEDKAKQTTKAAELRVAAATQQVEVAKTQATQEKQQAEQAQIATQLAKAEQAQATIAASIAQGRENAARVDLSKAQQISDLEVRGTALVRTPPELLSNIDNLILAMQLGQKLQKINQYQFVQQNFSDTKNYARSPVLGLRIALNSVLGKDVNNRGADFPYRYCPIDHIGPDVGGDSTKPYEVCYGPSGTLRLEQYYRDGYYSLVYNERSGRFLSRLEGFSARFNVLGQIRTSGKTNSIFYDLSNINAGNLQGNFGIFSPNGKFIATYPDLLKSLSPTYLYDNSGALLALLEGAYPQFSSNSRYVVTHASSYKEDFLYLYDLNKPSEKPIRLAGRFPNFSPNSKYLATEHGLYRLPSLQFKDYGGERGLRRKFSLNEHYLAMSLAKKDSSSGFETVRVYNLLSGDFKDLPGFDASITSDGSLFVSHGGIDIYNLFDLSKPPLAIKGISFDLISSDGKRILSGTGGDISSNKDIDLYDTSGKNLATFKGYTGAFNSIGSHIVISTLSGNSYSLDDGASRLYNNSGDLIREFEGSFARFSPDGKKLLVSSRETTRIYNIAGNFIAEFPGIHPQLSADGSKVVTFSADGSGRIWQMDNGLDDLLVRGCKWLDTYFISNSEAFEKLEVCQTQERKVALASASVERSDNLVQFGNNLKDYDFNKAISYLSRALALDSKLATNASSWNKICWFGSLNGYPAQVLDVCEKAVLTEPDFGGRKDSRGLARALTGKTTGAIEDFEAYVKSSDNSVRKAQRQRWIDDLRAGKPPSAIFTKDVLEQLRNE
jgi:hypothetical protein